MFNSGYGGIESDGMYRGGMQYEPQPNEGQPVEPAAETMACRKEKRGLFEKGFLKNIGADDLILIGIALLLLLDGDDDNDIFVFIIAALVLM